MSLAASRAWLREHANEHRGLWVVVQDGALVGSDEDLETLDAPAGAIVVKVLSDTGDAGSIHEIRFDVWCACGELISVYGEEDGTIEHRCGACDRYIISGTYQLTLTVEEAEDV